PPACESEIVRVVVGRVVALGWGLSNRRPYETVDTRHPEVRRRCELELAFRPHLHGHLSVPPARRFEACGHARLQLPGEGSPFVEAVLDRGTRLFSRRVISRRYPRRQIGGGREARFRIGIG